MGITMSFVSLGFLCWLIIRRRLKDKLGRYAEIVCLVCLGTGFAVGLWADSETIQAILNAMQRGPSPKY